MLYVDRENRQFCKQLAMGNYNSIISSCQSAAYNNRLLKKPSMTECRARGHIGQMIKYDEIYKSYEKSIHNNAMQCPCSNDRHYVCQNFL